MDDPGIVAVHAVEALRKTHPEKEYWMEKERDFQQKYVLRSP